MFKIKIAELKRLSKTQLVNIILEQPAGLKFVLQQNKQLQDRITELELLVAKLTKDSSNSSKPSSTDFRGPDKPSSHNRNSRNPSGKKSGGQPGHNGTTRSNVDNPDEVVACAPTGCTGCGNDLTNPANRRVSEIVSTAQVADIPPVMPIITEYQRLRITCVCGQTNDGQYPDFVVPAGGIQLGPTISSFLVYLNSAHHLPYARLQTIVRDLLGFNVSEGTISNKLSACAQAAETVQAKILNFLHGSSWVGSDETGARVAGSRWWQWVWQNAQASYYAVSPSRGYKVIKEHFGESFAGTLVHDCLSAQNKTVAGFHQLCHAHLFRDLQFLIDTKGEHTVWAYRLKRLLYQSQRARDHCWATEFDPVMRARILQYYHYQLTGLLGWELTSPESRKLQRRLLKHQAKLLHFMTSPDMPADNNGSERAIRNAKVKQKVSGGYRSQAGAERQAVLLSVIESSKKQNKNVLSIIQQLIRGETVDLFGAE